MRRKPSARFLMALLGIALAAPACGTRVERASVPAPASTIGGSPSAETGIPSSQGTEAAPASSAIASGHPAAQPGTTSVSRATSSNSSVARPGTPAASNGGVSSTKGPDRPAAAPATNAGGDRAVPVPAKPGGAKSPVTLASVGTLSGPAGGVLAPILAGSQVWVKWINEKGGLNGHTVNLIVYDDGGDTARHNAQVREAIERRGAIAFLTNVEVLTGQGAASYITSKRVPVVGMSGGENWAADSPMYFPQKTFGTGLYSLFPRTFAPALVPKGITKWGIVVCVEAHGCKELPKTFAEEADKLGYKLVHQAQASIAQPDFTAECLSARNAGAQAIHVNLDQSSIERFAAACNRQGYHPQYMIPSAALADRLKDNALLDGAISTADVFPWFVTGTPAVDEFHAAMKSFGANVPPGLGPVEGWVSGKLFEVAASSLAEPPTSAQILAGLWKIRNNTLGGLTAPLTFTENQATQPYSCGALIAIRNGKWVAPDPEIKCYP